MSLPRVEQIVPAAPSTSVVDTGAFCVGALLLGLATRGLIPVLVHRGWEPLLAWFAAGSLVVFLPLLALGAAVLRSEGGPWTRARLRLQPPTRHDWALIAAGTLVVGLLSGLLALVMRRWVGAELAPPFLRVEPLGAGRLWILAVWLPFWILNVLAEEFIWRAVLLPRQEARFGRWAWLVQALLWALFHASFGVTVLVLVVPTLLVVPFVAQHTRNTFCGVAVHALSNGPPFVLIALGLI